MRLEKFVIVHTMKTIESLLFRGCWMLAAWALMANAHVSLTTSRDAAILLIKRPPISLAQMEYELMEEIQSVTSDCMLQHKLTPDQLGQLRSQTTSDDSPTLKPTDNLQVYTQENVPCDLKDSRLYWIRPPTTFPCCSALRNAS